MIVPAGQVITVDVSAMFFFIYSFCDFSLRLVIVLITILQVCMREGLACYELID